MVTVTGDARRQFDTGSGDPAPGTAGTRKHGAALLTGSDRQEPVARNQLERNRGEPRQPRTIRFSDSEWSLIEQAAARHRLTAAEIVRSSALAFAEDRLFESPAASLSPGHIALVEATWRAVYLLATLATAKMRYEEIDDLVGAAHNAMIETMNKGPDRSAPGEESSSAGRRKRNGETGPVPNADARTDFH